MEAHKSVPLFLALSLVLVPSALADDRQLSCTVDVGTGTPLHGAPGASAEVAGNALGTCTLGTLETASVVDAKSIPDGCHASADTDGDQVYESEVDPGQSYPGDTMFRLFCDAGVVDATGTVDVVDAGAKA